MGVLSLALGQQSALWLGGPAPPHSTLIIKIASPAGSHRQPRHLARVGPDLRHGLPRVPHRPPLLRPATPHPAAGLKRKSQQCYGAFK